MSRESSYASHHPVMRSIQSMKNLKGNPSYSSNRRGRSRERREAGASLEGDLNQSGDLRSIQGVIIVKSLAMFKGSVHC